MHVHHYIQSLLNLEPVNFDRKLPENFTGLEFNAVHGSWKEALGFSRFFDCKKKLGINFHKCIASRKLLCQKKLY